MNFDKLTTEQNNASTLNIDAMSSLEIVRAMNDEDRKVAEAVALVEHAIGRAIDEITSRMKSGGRLVYIGAGTSGRLGVLDASECPPTFNTRPEQVVGIIAGGPRALTNAIEGAEDDIHAAAQELQSISFSQKDVLVGIASSGRTPYVIGGLDYAKGLGAFTIGLTCNPKSELDSHVDLVIAPVVGPEVISGSTRLKAGTATKMVLNMLTTGTMVLLGKTYGNWMVDLRATNIKLKARSVRIVSSLTGLQLQEATALLEDCDGELKVAIVAAKKHISPAEARSIILLADGKLRTALEL